MLGLFASNIEDFLGSRFVRSGLLFYRGSVSILIFSGDLLNCGVFKKYIIEDSLYGKRCI